MMTFTLVSIPYMGKEVMTKSQFESDLLIVSIPYMGKEVWVVILIIIGVASFNSLYG